jgi:hypothetical protein
MCTFIQIEVTSLCMCVSISATVALACLFAPKIYIVIFQPHKNVRSGATSSMSNIKSARPWPVLSALGRQSTFGSCPSQNGMLPAILNPIVTTNPVVQPTVNVMFCDSMDDDTSCDEDEAMRPVSTCVADPEFEDNMEVELEQADDTANPDSDMDVEAQVQLEYRSQPHHKCDAYDEEEEEEDEEEGRIEGYDEDEEEDELQVDSNGLPESASLDFSSCGLKEANTEEYPVGNTLVQRFV